MEKTPQKKQAQEFNLKCKTVSISETIRAGLGLLLYFSDFNKIYCCMKKKKASTHPTVAQKHIANSPRPKPIQKKEEEPKAENVQEKNPQPQPITTTEKQKVVNEQEQDQVVNAMENIEDVS
jgi:outer membrane biosynthesis protein TonB